MNVTMLTQLQILTDFTIVVLTDIYLYHHSMSQVKRICEIFQHRKNIIQGKDE